MLHAQPSATTSCLCLCVQSWGPWSSTSRRRQQTGAVGPSHTATLPPRTLRTYIHTYRSRSREFKPNPANSERAEPTPDDRQHSLSCSPGNIINNTQAAHAARPARLLACSLVCTHASTPTSHSTQHACRSCRTKHADRFCFYLLYKYCFPCLLAHSLAGLHLHPVPVPDTTPHHNLFVPTSPVSGHLQLQNGPRLPTFSPRPAAACRSKNKN